jgi:hypothetical protein
MDEGGLPGTVPFMSEDEFPAANHEDGRAEGSGPPDGADAWLAELLAWSPVQGSGPAEDGDEHSSEHDEDDEDEGIADPGCMHPWYRLDFVDDAAGLGCSRCGTAWILDEEEEVEDAVMVVWQAARVEFERLQSRHDSMASVVESLSGLRHCHSCDRWGPPAEFAQVSGMHCCPHHVGAMLAQMSDPRDSFHAAAEWLIDSGHMGSLSPMRQWLVETNILDFPPLEDACGRADDVLNGVKVTVSGRTAARLGTPEELTVAALAGRVAELLDLDEPTTRPATVFLLGLAAHADNRLRAGMVLEANAIVADATPTHGTYRAIIVMDLCRSDMPDEGTFTGDMADDLVRALGLRAVEVLKG